LSYEILILPWKANPENLGVITHAKDPATRNSGIHQDDTFEYLNCVRAFGVICKLVRVSE